MEKEKEKRYAFVNMPDVSSEDLQYLVDNLQALYENKKIDSKYQLVFIGGKEWKTIGRDELVEVLNNIFESIKAKKVKEK